MGIHAFSCASALCLQVFITPAPVYSGSGKHTLTEIQEKTCDIPIQEVELPYINIYYSTIWQKHQLKPVLQKLQNSLQERKIAVLSVVVVTHLCVILDFAASVSVNLQTKVCYLVFVRALGNLNEFII